MRLTNTSKITATECILQCLKCLDRCVGFLLNDEECILLTECQNVMNAILVDWPLTHAFYTAELICPTGFSKYGTWSKSCYKTVTEPKLSWEDAKSHCENLGPRFRFGGYETRQEWYNLLRMLLVKTCGLVPECKRVAPSNGCIVKFL